MLFIQLMRLASSVGWPLGLPNVKWGRGITVSKCPKSPKLTNIVIEVKYMWNHHRWKNDARKRLMPSKLFWWLQHILNRGKWLQCGMRYGTSNEKKKPREWNSRFLSLSRNLFSTCFKSCLCLSILEILLSPHNIKDFHPQCIDFFYIWGREVGREGLACVWTIGSLPKFFRLSSSPWQLLTVLIGNVELFWVVDSIPNGGRSICMSFWWICCFTLRARGAGACRTTTLQTCEVQFLQFGSLGIRRRWRSIGDIKSTFKHLHYIPHTRPLLRVILSAPQPYSQRSPELLLIHLLRRQPIVDHISQVVLRVLHLIERPDRVEPLLGRVRQVDSSSPADELQEGHSVAVHIHLRR